MRAAADDQPQALVGGLGGEFATQAIEYLRQSEVGHGGFYDPRVELGDVEQFIEQRFERLH